MTSQTKLPIPSDFICPITQEIMKNPVLLVEDGHSYELDAIERWLRNHNSSPITNKSLVDRRFVNNFNLKSAIEEYCIQQQIQLYTDNFLAFNIRQTRIPAAWTDKPTLTIRISLLGSSNAGKTTLARYLQYGSQSALVRSNSELTVGPDLLFFYLDQLYEDEYVIVVQLTDIPGMERYESCCDNHFRSCHGALLLTDLTDIDSLERAELYWYKQLQLKGKEYVESVLICNKVDLFEKYCDQDYRRIYVQRAEYLASLHKMPMHYISALRGDNVRSIFKQLILQILQNESLLAEIKENGNVPEKSSAKSNIFSRNIFDQGFSRSSSTENYSNSYSVHKCC